MNPKLQSQRERQVRSLDLIFSGSITDDEYQELVEASKWRACPYCGDQFNVALGFDGPNNGHGGTRYCSPRCVERAEIAGAPLVKPASNVVTIDGYDV